MTLPLPPGRVAVVDCGDAERGGVDDIPAESGMPEDDFRR